MKKYFLLLCCLTVWSLSTSKSWSDEALTPLNIKNATAEEGFLVLSRTYGSDIYVDSTGISAVRTTHEFQSEDPRNKFPVRTRLLSWAQDHKLSTLQNEDSFLFWPEPDIESLYQEMKNGSGLIPESPMPTPIKLRVALQAHLQINPQNVARLTVPFHLQDTPSELGKLIAAISIEKVINPSRNDYHTRYFEDSFWQNARLSYNPPKPIPPNVTLGNIKIDTDPMWPFQLQTINEDEHPRTFIEFDPLGGTRKREEIEAVNERESLEKRARGLVRVRVLESRSYWKDFPDWRLTETTPVKPNAQTQRLIETRPSSEDDKGRWQKVEDKEQILQALKALGEEDLPPDFGEKSLKALSELNGKVALALLPADEVLEKPITLEVQRQPLPDVLKELSRQSGIALTTSGMSPEESTKLLLTARVQAKPLRQVMQHLARLYGIEWSRPQIGSYLAYLPERSNWRTKLLQFGNFTYYRCRNLWNDEHNQRVQKLRDLSRQVWEKFGEEAITAPKSVPFTDLPIEVQQGIRKEAESAARYILMQQQIRAVEQLRGDLTFQLDSQLRQLGIFVDGKLHSIIRLGVPLNKLTTPVTPQ